MSSLPGIARIGPPLSSVASDTNNILTLWESPYQHLNDESSGDSSICLESIFSVGERSGVIMARDQFGPRIENSGHRPFGACTKNIRLGALPPRPIRCRHLRAAPAARTKAAPDQRRNSAGQPAVRPRIKYGQALSLVRRAEVEGHATNIGSCKRCRRHFDFARSRELRSVRTVWGKLRSLTRLRSDRRSRRARRPTPPSVHPERRPEGPKSKGKTPISAVVSDAAGTSTSLAHASYAQ